MRKCLAANRHSEFPAVREVRLAQHARTMLLGKEHFLRRPFGRPPVLDPALQCSHLSVWKPTRVQGLQILKQCFRLYSWLQNQPLENHLPDHNQRARTSATRNDWQTRL